MYIFLRREANLLMAVMARQLLFDLLHHAFLLVVLLALGSGGGSLRGGRGGHGILRVLVLVLPSGDLLLELVFYTFLLPPPTLSIVLRLRAFNTCMSVQSDTRTLRIDLIRNITGTTTMRPLFQNSRTTSLFKWDISSRFTPT